MVNEDVSAEIGKERIEFLNEQLEGEDLKVDVNRRDNKKNELVFKKDKWLGSSVASFTNPNEPSSPPEWADKGSLKVNNFKVVLKADYATKYRSLINNVLNKLEEEFEGIENITLEVK